MAKSIAAYIRVSTEEQNTDGQEAEVKGWIEKSGIAPGAVEWFTDKESGKTLNREAFNRLKAGIQAGTIKTVIVYKLDRISRKMVDGMVLLSQWAGQGVRVVSVTQHIDLSGVMGQMMATILMGFAQMELEYRAERQAAGIREAKSQGIYKGRAKGTTKAQPARAAELKAKGLTPPEIATALGCSIRTVHRYMGLGAA
jgi:DNA invertase Pin-like site-specific DNA recombinase